MYPFIGFAERTGILLDLLHKVKDHTLLVIAGMEADRAELAYLCQGSVQGRRFRAVHKFILSSPAASRCSRIRPRSENDDSPLPVTLSDVTGPFPEPGQVDPDTTYPPGRRSPSIAAPLPQPAFP